MDVEKRALCGGLLRQSAAIIQLAGRTSMTNLKRWSYVILLGAIWSLLYGSFLRLESGIEPGLFANNRQAYWWLIVLSYWLADTLVVLCFARTIARPFGLPMPPEFPFFQFGSDLAVLVLLVHIAWACTDRYLFPDLKSLGLATLPALFLSIATAWAIIGFLKYRQPVKLTRQLSRP